MERKRPSLRSLFLRSKGDAEPSPVASSSGAYWRDWFQHNETGLSEAHRLAYVAFSRAKHLLALGIPNPPSAPLSETDKQMLTDLGFEIVEIGS